MLTVFTENGLNALCIVPSLQQCCTDSQKLMRNQGASKTYICLSVNLYTHSQPSSYILTLVCYAKTVPILDWHLQILHFW